MSATPTESAHERQVWLPTASRLLSSEGKVSRVPRNDDLAAPTSSLFRLPGDEPSPERDALYQTIREQACHLDRLTAQVDQFMQRQRELRTMLMEAQAGLAQRDAELEQIRARHLAEIEARTAEVTSRLYSEILQRDAAAAELRAWALGQIEGLTERLTRSEQQVKAFRSSRWWRMRRLVKRIIRV